ncbi:poly-gamma-glutamate biosynthesis protein PgsC/CapC [Pseudoalteromonas sp. S16_S37]|uniref:poly-gamma-glutamate biosynthesis protein PgsC/CapC n=1 Tax=Pseudoalteromonas sp. S16_S37 TaxID=2720228 RepID=UPI0016810C61|nr:poly-gamma-glutamate biosynthesis protein PgsC/CapC [Pseudoalteromonas sp. S16_S37]MBD1581479.1 hypothetical protein [Pseudoalteromonas sp. S16_S37]
MDWVLPLFPTGSGLSQSVITTVWVGIAIVCFFNLRFGFPLTGLVVPGYIVPLLIVSPTSAVVIFIEAIVVYWIMRLSAQLLMEKFGYAEMFGRDRFFAIILISILVRVAMDSMLWPMIANELRLWDISFDYASDLHSLGLVIIALAANVMWNHGFKYGVKITTVQLLCTYLIVRYVLMPFTNFSIANLAIMYEAVAASIVAAPKAYIILVLTAFIASRANLRYGWEFNGILLPALLALQLLQPSKLLTSFIETAVILLIGGTLLHFTRLKSANLEGARLLLFFFNIGFAYKLALNYALVHFYPTVKVTDTFAFGYMLSTLLALKIYQKSALGLIIRATFQTSILGGALAIVIGFLIMFLPSLLDVKKTTDITQASKPVSISAQLSDYRSALYTASQTPFSIGQYQHNLNINQFKSAVNLLANNRENLKKIKQATEIFNEIGFGLQQGSNYLYIQDLTEHTPRGLFVLAKNPTAAHIVTVPYPTSERRASDTAGMLFEYLQSSALAIGTAKTSLDNTLSVPQSAYYQAFIEAINLPEVLQIRELTKQSKKTLPTSYTDKACQAWVFNQLPDSISQNQLRDLLSCDDFSFGLVLASNLPYPNYSSDMLEVYINSENYIHLLAQMSLKQSGDRLPVAHHHLSVVQAIDDYAPHISAKGSGYFTELSHKDAALWEFEILRPLLQISDELAQHPLDVNIANQLANINKIAHLKGYQITRISDAQNDYLMISPRPEPRYFQLGQGLYFIRLGQANLTNIQVPRPLFESHTLKFSGALYSSAHSKSLMIAGAHPLASPAANVMKPTNTTSLFNVFHQSLLRYYQAQPVLNLQIRSHSAPSKVRPTAISFINTTPSDSHNNLLAQLDKALVELGVDYEIVTGQQATRGLEIGSSAQTGYEVFAANSELAALWLASDYKQHFATSSKTLRQRLTAISSSTSILQIKMGDIGASTWLDLSTMQRATLKELTENYAKTLHLPYLSKLCEAQPNCYLEAAYITDLNEFALLVRKNDYLMAMYLPTRNTLVDKQNYTSNTPGDNHVLH